MRIPFYLSLNIFLSLTVVLVSPPHLHAQSDLSEPSDIARELPPAPAIGLPALNQTDDPVSALLLARARQNHFSGDFSATVVCIRSSYLEGIDTLQGVLEVRVAAGEKRLSLRGPNTSFEWWSRLNGREQWRREGLNGRPRRIAPHSMKKPAFAADVNFEDLARLPFGHLEGYRSVRRASGIDSADRLNFVPGNGLSVLYASSQALFSRDPVLLRRIVFTGAGGRPSKRMDIPKYTAEAGGYFPAEIVFAGADGLSSVRIQLTRMQNDPARDKMEIPGIAPRRFAEPEWVPRDAVTAP